MDSQLPKQLASQDEINAVELFGKKLSEYSRDELMQIIAWLGADRNRMLMDHKRTINLLMATRTAVRP